MPTRADEVTTSSIFGRDRALVGMVHVAALPGTPGHALPMPAIIARAMDEARQLIDAGFDALIVENMHDVPYLRRSVGPEIVAGMTAVAAAVRTVTDRPLGVQVLAGANREALAVAHTVGAGFIRAEGFVFASVADEGLLEAADAGPLLRYRRAIGADRVHILADVKKKHSAHALTADVDVAEMTKAADFFGADGVIVTGIATGQPIRLDDLGSARVATQRPLIVGSGVTPDSVADLFAYADALVVGSWLKRDGHWYNPIDADRARAVVAAVNAVRGSA
ncbi:MAG: BtpA/SgcQ family protein [Planctomycetota bacterium]|jgi:membrane complex biogenesis BtpA family protein